MHFPLIVKPNIGGSGAGIRRFDTYLALVETSKILALDSVDGTLLFRNTTRAPIEHRALETLEHRYLYAFRVHLGDEDGFDLCPAILQEHDGGALVVRLSADAVKRA